jgi:integrase
MPLKIYRRGDVWHYRGTVARRRLRGSTGATNKEIAARYAAEIENKFWKRGFDGPEAVLTFAQASIKYRAAGKQTRFLERIEDYWKDTLVKDINAGAITQSARELYPRAANATRNRHVIIPTQAVINHAAELGLCGKISVKRFDVFTKLKKPATIAWVRSFMESTPPHLGGLAIFMLLTGARVSEALSVDWADVDLEKRTALIRQSKIGAERLAHLPQELVVALANIPKETGRKVFRYTTKAAADKSWRAAIKRAGIEPLSFHCCRHGFATALLHEGVDVVTIARLGGWKSAEHVLKTYGHAKDDITLTDRISGSNLTHEEIDNSEMPYKTRGSR